MVGIYKITNLIDNKVYIGQSKNLKSRLGGHKSCLKHNHHSNIYLQRAYNKYGAENFKFEIIEECEEDKLTEREQYWIDFYGGMNSNSNYNFKEASSPGKFSELSRQKMSAAKLGTKREKWVCEKLSQSFKGHPGYMTGKHHTEETKEKLRQLHLGKKQTPEHIKNATEARIRNGSYEKQKTDRVRLDKISKALTGKKHTEEQKQHISNSIKIWWEERKKNGCTSNNKSLNKNIKF